MNLQVTANLFLKMLYSFSFAFLSAARLLPWQNNGVAIVDFLHLTWKVQLIACRGICRKDGELKKLVVV